METNLQTTMLDNGARLITISRPHCPTSSVAVDWRVGSRFESRTEGGLSHFLEHMVFQGCDGFPSPRAVNESAELMGSTLDACTSRDQTHFEHRVANDALESSAHLVLSLLTTPKFEALETERSIILEEALDEFSVDGRRIDPDTTTRRSLWGRKALGQPIIGELPGIEGYSQKDIRRFHQRHYSGANAIVSLAGPQTHEELLKIGSNFDRIKSGVANGIKPTVMTKKASQILLAPDERSQCDCRVVFGTPGRTAGDSPALVMLRLALDDGLASRMQIRLGTELGLAYEQWAFWESYPDTGAFELGAVLSPDKVLTFFYEVSLLLKGLVTSPPMGEELDRLRFRARWALESATESNAGLFALYSTPYLYGEPIRSIAERLERLMAVTPARLAEAAKQLISYPHVAAVVGPCDGLSTRRIRNELRRSWDF
jgi:predicted Zn-dependent peptidase